LPEFFNGYRSLWQEGKKYNYQQLRNGSYLRYMPNHYQLGYMLVAHGREAYGPEFWRKVTQDAVRLKPFFYPLQGAVKKHSGVSYGKFVDEAFRTFRDDSLMRGDNGAESITEMHKRTVRDYLFPVVVGKDSVLVLKDSYRRVPGIVILHDGRESRLRTRDITIDGYHTYRNGKLVYTAWKPEIRWAWQDFSNILVMDLHSGKVRRVTSRSRYFSPDLSPDEREIAAVQVRKDGSSRIHLVDASSGQLVRELDNPNGYFHTYPVFSRRGDEIFTAVRNGTGQMALVAIHKETGAERVLVPFSNRPIAFLRVRGDYILFTASYNRKDALWAWDDASGTLMEIGGHYTGSYMPDLDTATRKIVYSGFRTGGYMLYRMPMPESRPTDLARWTSGTASTYAEKALDQESATNIYRGAKDGHRAFPTDPYKSTTRLFNFHSWRPWYEQPDWSITAFSENVLNTFRSEIFYTYNENEGYHKVGFNGLFGGWYPWITGGASYTMDRFFSDGATGSGYSTTLNWDELNIQAGFRLPFNFSGGRNYRFLTVSGTFNNQQLFFRETPSGKPGDQDYRYLQGNLSWSMQGQQARQHIFPRFAHALNLQYRGGIGELKSQQFLATAAVYLPGLHPNHNLVLGASFQSRDTLAQYVFTNNFALSRGYPGVDFPRMARGSFNYHFPLFYPELGLANIVYFLRVRANTWFDATTLKSLRTGKTTMLRSTGVEIFFDTRWWNQQPISFGVRYARLLDTEEFFSPPGKNQWQIILPINLIPN
jgi:hypothetical protein